MANRSPATGPLAHSPRPKRGIPPQTYAEHVSHVVLGSVGRAEDAARFSPEWGGPLVAVVRLASEYHDLGKLDTDNQAVLSSDSRRPLPWRHEDAGVAHLLNGAAASLQHKIACLLIYSHHSGIPSLIEEENRRGKLCFRFDGVEGQGRGPVWERTDARLDSYRAAHDRAVAGLLPPPPEFGDSGLGQLMLRIALSCLIDADHSDTAGHYGNAPSKVAPPGRWNERLAALDAYVEGLSRGKDDRRTGLRREVYDACRQADPAPALRECDSPVGTGKTTAVMAHLLRAAKRKGLRRLFVVLPYTNIIDQAVEVYRKSLTLPGEDAEAVVAAVHHKAEYSDPDSRHLAALWDAPVVVTTAVQFFETLAARSTDRLRKLHALVGAGIFIDESHAALPAKLWPQAWDWIKQLADQWGCHFVLGSGSLNRIWTIEGINPRPEDLPPLVELPSIRASVDDAEERRVTIRSREDPLTLDRLVEWLADLPGPRLLIVNTVQIAAALAAMLAEKNGPGAVMHLSTALTPHHRDLTLRRVTARLAYRSETDWTLVATSCIESGVDVSFRTGLRQRARLSSLLQMAGRINRNEEYESAEVCDFRLIPGGLVNIHRDLEVAAQVLERHFAEGKVSPKHCTDALRSEILETRCNELNEELKKAESAFDFPGVQKLFRVIDAETCTAVISKSLQERIEKGDRIDWRELQRHSVQIYSNRAEWLSLKEVPDHPGVFFWDLPYDDFLGYMAGVLPLLKGQDGGFIV